MIICLCHRISDRAITEAVQDGIRDFETLQDETCIARNCGCCEQSARQVFDQACTTIQVHRPCRKPERDGSALAAAA